MKKIVSALALGALVFGAASAKTSVNLNYRNGANMFSYGESYAPNTDFTYGRSEWFNLNGHNGGNDNLNLKAEGDIFKIQLNSSPSIKSNYWDIKAIQTDATFGALHAAMGWNADGNFLDYRMKTVSPWESQIGGEIVKPGSFFKNSFARDVLSYTTIAATDARLFGEGDFTIAFTNSDASVRLIGAWIGDNVINTSNADGDFDNNIEGYGRTGWAAQILEGNPNANAKGTAGDIVQKDAMGWVAGVDVKLPSVFGVTAVMKGIPYVAWNAANSDKNKADRSDGTVDNPGLTNRNLTDGDREEIGVFVPGLYFRLDAIKNLRLVAGGAVSIYDWNISDFAFDVNALVNLFDNRLQVTYAWNLSIANPDHFNTSVSGQGIVPVAAKGVGQTLASGSFGNLSAGLATKSCTLMYNHLGVAFTLNKTFKATLDVGALTDLGGWAFSSEGDGARLAYQDGAGTNLSVTPGVQIFANSKAFVAAGVNFTIEGIGKEDECGIKDKSGDLLGDGLNFGVSIPVLFRVQL